MRRGSPAWLRIDGLLALLVGSILLFDVIPESLHVAGPWALVLVLLGIVVVVATRMLLWRGFRVIGAGATAVWFAAVALGLCLHGLWDGMALVEHGQGDGWSIALAVVLHRLPMGMTVWWLAEPRVGILGSVVLLVILGGATAVGQEVGAALFSGLPAKWMAGLHAFVAGGLLHVMSHWMSRLVPSRVPKKLPTTH